MRTIPEESVPVIADWDAFCFYHEAAANRVKRDFNRCHGRELVRDVEEASATGLADVVDEYAKILERMKREGLEEFTDSQRNGLESA